MRTDAPSNRDTRDPPIIWAGCPQVYEKSIPFTLMRYVLRADASSSVGAGHVMRSSAIAEELISRGKEVVFVGQTNELSWLSSRILSLGFAGINTNSNDFKSDPKNDVLILDSYLIPINDSFIRREKWVAVVTIIDEHTPQ
jgi:spore coat polysaccharide biosynthesis predicted glycosyltransferase SpsG